MSQTINNGDSLIKTTMINSGGWKDEPYRSPTIRDIRRKIGRRPSDARHFNGLIIVILREYQARRVRGAVSTRVTVAGKRGVPDEKVSLKDKRVGPCINRNQTFRVGYFSSWNRFPVRTLLCHRSRSLRPVQTINLQDKEGTLFLERLRGMSPPLVGEDWVTWAGELPAGSRLIAAIMKATGNI